MRRAPVSLSFVCASCGLALAAALGWSGRARAQQAVEAPPLRMERALGAGRPTKDDRIGPTTYARAQSISGEPDKSITLTGDAEIRREGLVLRGDRMHYEIPLDTLTIDGNARVFQGGAAFSGPRMIFHPDARTGQMDEPDFTYAPRHGRGNARVVEFLEGERVTFRDARYNNCAPGDEAWWVRGGSIALDRGDELGVARNARLEFQGLTLFASPYFQFPLGDGRRSGILTPSFGINSRLGPEVNVPIYWNIAPNRDATFTPRIMARRGVLFANEFRYLEPTYRGTWLYDILPEDRERDAKRELVSIRHDYQAPSGVAAGLNFNRVSDDAYFVDFGQAIVTTSQRVLPQEGFVSYVRPTWNTALRVVKNQTLQDPLAPLVKPYEKVPQLSVNGQRYDLGGFDVSVAMDATRFGHPTLEEGSRYILNPVVSYPLLAPGWFVVPKVQWHATQYSLDEALRPTNASPTRTLPMASLDAGLVFEREGSWFGRDALQTLEPRLYYAKVPFRDQSTLPVFDTAEADFNFSQLFTENRFVGGDRISEADQLTAALVGRVIDPETGAERLRAAIGQRFYFGQERVTLPGEQPRTDRESDLLLSASGAIDRRWILDGSLQHSTLQNQIVRASLGVRYQPRPSSVVSMRYRYKLEEIDQIDVAAQWPLDFMGLPRWYGVGRANYSSRDSSWVEVLAGLEYQADCWVMRVVAQSYVTSTSTRTTSVFFQLELNGLGGVGSSPVETLKRTIPGYQVINRAPATPGRYDVYE